MKNNLLKRRTLGAHKSRGFTLIELMVVVIIIGILASLATFGYKLYMNQARMSRLQSYVMSLASKQTDALNRQVVVPFNVGAYTAANRASYRNILGFDEEVMDGIQLDTEAWTPDTGGNCSRCAAYGIPAPTQTTGFMVVATQDMQPGGARSTVYYTSETGAMVELNVGE